MVELAAVIFADGPTSDPYQPPKAQIRAWGTWLENLVQAFISTGGRIYPTLAALNADLAKDANSMAWVIEDPIATNNGVYRKAGASGTGAWVRAGDLPYSFIVAEDTGQGTPNAIKASTSVPVSPSALTLLYVYQTNGPGPVTVQFNNSGPLYVIKTNSGNDPVAGGLVGGSILAGRADGSSFRLISDQASASIVAAAEAAAEAAAGYAAIANKVFFEKVFAGNGTPGPFSLGTDPGGRANCFVYVDGYPQFNFSLQDGNKILFDEPIPTTSEIRVRFGSAINGIGSLGTQDASAVAITGGSVTGITDISVADGGTGASTASAARANLGLTNAATMSVGTGSWVPDLTFGGAKVGVTYSTQEAYYSRQGRYVFVTCLIILTSKGSSVGSARVGGLPFASKSNSATERQSLMCATYAAFASAVIAPFGVISAGGNGIDLVYAGGGGQVSMTDAHFTATSAIRLSGIYDIGSLT